MRKDVPPQKISKLRALPTSPVPVISSPNDIFKISKDGSLVWTARGCTLEVFTCPQLRRINHWSFPSLAKSPDVFICAVEEIPSGGGPGGYRASAAPHLLVALSGLNLLCLFDICNCRVIKCIQLPIQVSNLEVISSQGGACLQTLPLYKDLRILFGVVAVGTIAGDLLLVDLCLDEPQRSNEIAPAQSRLVGHSNSELTYIREEAIEHNEHICLALTAPNNSQDHFIYKGPHKALGAVSLDDASVTALLYVPQATLLVVGFKFGCFQLWDLNNLSIVFSSALTGDAFPVVRFAFQEPENDPRNFCYLWVVCGQDKPLTDSDTGTTTASLYSLSFDRKDWEEGLGFRYMFFNHCVMRFEHLLTGDPFNVSDSDYRGSSRLVHFSMVQDNLMMTSNRPQDLEEPQADEWTNQDKSLCLMVWEAWDPPEPPGYYMALFDINQWYHDQMPFAVRYLRPDVCSFFGVFSLDEVLEKISFSTHDCTLQDVLVPLRSLRRFRTISPMDEVYYPSSLGFKATCLTDCGIIEVSYLGTQKQLLWELQSLGHSYLKDPTELFLHFRHSGLLSKSESITLNQKRESLLSLALEHDLLSYLKECILKAPTVDHHSGGVSLRFLTDWAWKRASKIKSAVDRLCVPLFNCSGQELEPSNVDALYNYSSQLQTLTRLYQIMKFRAMESITQAGFEELSMQEEVVQLLSMYLQVILWLQTYCCLLPEHAEGEAYGENEVAYPASLLTAAYSQRRVDLHRLHSSVGPTDLLMIDGLMTKLGDSVLLHWERVEGNGGQRLYPPPSLFAFLSIYLAKSVPVMDKHCLTLYLLLDMADFLSHTQSHLEERLMQFPAAFGMPPSLVKIIQGFWMLDRKDFAKATSFLTDPVICSCDLNRSHHTRVLKALLFQGQERHSLRYMTIRQAPLDSPEDIKLHLSILLSNRLIGEAYNFQRQRLDEDLLNHFFLGCQQTQNMRALLELPLTSVEEQSLIRFLSESSEPKAKEMLIIYFLQRHRPLEALEFTDKLNRKSMQEGSSSVCTSLVNQFIKILPPAQVSLFKELSKPHSRSLTSGRVSENVAAVPLSSLVIRNSCLEEASSQSTHYRGIVEALSSTWNKQALEPQTPLRLRRARVSDIWTTDSMPFVGTPAASRQSRKSETELVYATPVGKRPISSITDMLESPRFPNKKSRGMDIVSPMKRITSERRENRAFSAEAMRLLQTPPIKRQVPELRVKTPSRATPKLTSLPQSILKPSPAYRSPFNSGVKSLYSSFSGKDQENKVEGRIDMDLEDSPSISEDGDFENPEDAAQIAFEPVESPNSSASTIGRRFSKSSSITAGSPSFHRSDDIIVEDEDVTFNMSIHHRRMNLQNLGRRYIGARAEEMSDDMDSSPSAGPSSYSHVEESVVEVKSTFIKESFTVNKEESVQSLTMATSSPAIANQVLEKPTFDIEHKSEHSSRRSSASPSNNFVLAEEPVFENEQELEQSSRKSTSSQSNKSASFQLLESGAETGIDQTEDVGQPEPIEEQVFEIIDLENPSPKHTSSTSSQTIFPENVIEVTPSLEEAYEPRYLSSAALDEMNAQSALIVPMDTEQGSPSVSSHLELTSDDDVDGENEKSLPTQITSASKDESSLRPLTFEAESEPLSPNKIDVESLPNLSSSISIDISGQELEESGIVLEQDVGKASSMETGTTPSVTSSPILDISVQYSEDAGKASSMETQTTPSATSSPILDIPVQDSEVKATEVDKESSLSMEDGSDQAEPIRHSPVLLEESVQILHEMIGGVSDQYKKEHNTIVEEDTSCFIVGEYIPHEIQNVDETRPFEVVGHGVSPLLEETGQFEVDNSNLDYFPEVNETGPFEVEPSKTHTKLNPIKPDLRALKKSSAGSSSTSEPQLDSKEVQVTPGLKKKAGKTAATRRRVKESIVPVLPVLAEYSPPPSSEQSPSSSVFTTPEKASPSLSWSSRLRVRSDSRTSSDSSTPSVNNSGSKTGQNYRRTSTPSPQFSSPFPQPSSGTRRTSKATKKGSLERDKQLDTAILPPPCTIPEEPEELQDEEECLTPKPALPFVFSPPSTRSRVRRKKSDTPDNTSLREDSMPQGIGLLSSARSSNRLQGGHPSDSSAPPWGDYINLISPFKGKDGKLRRSSTVSRVSTSTRHSMTLRTGPVKTRKVVKLK